MTEIANCITLKNVRLSMAQTLWTPKPPKYPKRAAHGILSDGDPQIKAVEALIEKVAKEKWTEMNAKTKQPAWKAVLVSLKAENKLCLKNGDTKAEFEGYAGNMFVSASNGAKVAVVDKDGKTPLAEGEGMYSGCRVDMNVQIWAQDNDFGKRINATLRWVQFRGDDDAFTGAPPASTDEIPDLSAEEEDTPLA